MYNKNYSNKRKGETDALAKAYCGIPGMIRNFRKRE